jgi:hypothetical protein
MELLGALIAAFASGVKGIVGERAGKGEDGRQEKAKRP